MSGTIFQICFLLVSFVSTTNAQQPFNPADYIEKFSDIMLDVPHPEHIAPLEQLLEQAENFRDGNPGSAEAWIACALVRTNLAFMGNPFGLLGKLRTGRREMETANELDREALGGFATAYLGRLYGVVPRWPISYGDHIKAEDLFREALSIDKNSTANNAYYGEFLLNKKQYAQAEKYLQLAHSSLTVSSAMPKLHAYLLTKIEAGLEVLADELEH